MTKVYITNGPDQLHSYINVSPLNQTTWNNIFNLDGVVDDGEVHEILAANIADYLPTRNLGNILAHYSKKLHHRGRLIIGGTDLMELCKAYLAGDLDSKQVNEAIYGEMSHSWSYKSTLSNMWEMSKAVKSVGLEIERKIFHDMNYIIEARRP